MPAVSEKQRRAACAEHGRRKKNTRGGKKRAFGTASNKQVRDFCRKKKKR
jgi:hypothetical protein